ncbi:MAG: hypothetical protein Q8922_03260 [Bacteroidota bacterium]|nr:hypothetical protein [Bacteroidota bacterium]MDP4232984.1 hypothetical protein [Bacteroidota bacterium]MDP4242028.1 hypothetical protein [Bacteroidota bacterium]MDP4286931.1 hypothetical protein [Bacteroidota bacterium]
MPTTNLISLNRLKSEFHDWSISALIVAPFAWVYVTHFLFSHGQGTGFFDYDMPYYSALGRAIFSRGNGILYPNPYDLNAPSIYFQWFPWLLGVGTVLLHADSGYLFDALGLIFSVALARTTLALIRSCVTIGMDRKHEIFYLALAFWGGGLLCAAGIANGFIDRGWQFLQLNHTNALAILQFDPDHGLWFLNWGRNTFFTTEALYHLLVAMVWLGVLRDRWRWAAVGLLLLAATHPWTGLEMIAIMLAYLVWTYIAGRARPPLWFQTVTVLCTAAFIWYYGVYLNQFDSHRRIVSLWKSEVWTVSDLSFVLSIASLLPLIIYRIVLRPPLRRGDEFLAVCFLISTVLSIHQHWMTPIQPIHFHHGYPWFSLFLFALPAIAKLTNTIAIKRRSLGVWAVSVMMLFFMFSDNVIFVISRTAESMNIMHTIRLSPPERQLFRWLAQSRAHGLFLARDGQLSYLSSAYTNVTPYLGQSYLTPTYERRVDTTTRFYSMSSSDLPFQLSYLLVAPSDSVCAPQGWSICYDRQGYRLYRVATGAPR